MWISKTSHTAGVSANEYNPLEKLRVGKFQPGGRLESLILSTSIPKYFLEENLACPPGGRSKKVCNGTESK